MYEVTLVQLWLWPDAESRLEIEKSSRQKAEKDLLEMQKLIGSLRVDVSQYEQRAAAVTQEITAETDKVDKNTVPPSVAVFLCWVNFYQLIT